MTTPTPALIFDFGNVIAFFDYGRAIESIASALDLDRGEVISRAPSLDALVKRYESGQIGTEEFIAAAIADLRLPIGHAAFATAWADIFWINAPVARLAKALKSTGHVLVLGSNTNPLHADHYRRRFASELACFDRIVLSYEVKHLKPARAFYLACAEAAGRPPAECVFIDDLRENVEGAREAGLRAIHYRDVESLRTDLQSLGVSVPS